MEGQYDRLTDHFTYEDSSRKRTTDLCCLLLFLLNGVLYSFLFISVLADSGWDKFHPYDSSGRLCGVAPDTLDFPYLYYVVPTLDLSYSVCVSSCPSAGNTFTCLPNAWVTSCGFAYKDGDQRSVSAEPYNSTELWGTVCYPDANDREKYAESANIASWLLEFQPPQSVFQLLHIALPYSLLWIIPMILCGMYFILLRHLARVVFWVVILATSCGVGFLGVTLMRSGEQDVTVYPVTSITGVLILILAVLYFLFALYLHERVDLASSVMKLGCAFLAEQYSLMLVGILCYLCVCAAVLISFGICFAIYIHGSVPNPQLPESRYPPFPVLLLDTKIISILIYAVFSGFWFIEFWLAFTHMVIINTTVKWYFMKHTITPYLQFIPSMLTTLRYNLGQVTFGALIQAILWPLCAVLNVLKMKLVLAYEGPNAVAKFLCSCVDLVFTTLAIGMTVLNRFILINLAYTDNTYCEGLHSSYLLLVKNPIRASVYGLSITFFMVTGLLGLGVSSVLITRFFLDLGSIGSFLLLYVIFTCFSSVFVFLEVFHVITDTILICLLQDLEDHIKDAPSRQVLASEALLSTSTG